MKQTLDVLSGIDAKAHSSFSSAVVKSKAASSDTSEHNLEKIRGMCAEKIIYGGECIIIIFENSNISAYITVGDNRVKCRLLSDHNHTSVSLNTEIPEIVELRFPSGRTAQWNRRRLFDSLVGKQIALVSSDQYLFLYVKNGADYMFDFLIERNQKCRPFLYLSEA